MSTMGITTVCLPPCQKAILKLIGVSSAIKENIMQGLPPLGPPLISRNWD
ncbi:MAG: hypothetical protein ACHQUC_09420 [Chlamydiales bacterium]